MTIISNSEVKGKSDKRITYDKFCELAFGDEGFDLDDGLAFNVNDLQEDVFLLLKDQDEDFVYFTSNGNIPSFIDVKVEDWVYKEPNFSSNMNDGVSNSNQNEFDSEALNAIENLLDESTTASDNEKKDAKIVVFGSSKGGTGKTFTAIISTYRYAKTHPHQKIALLDFDIIDGQVGISIHKIKPTMRDYFTEYNKGMKDFMMMHNFSLRANNPYPQNVDFYLAPNSDTIIKDDEFWLTILQNCIENYDVLVIDTGIDYLNLRPISYAYKIADKINIITTTSIKSVNSVTKQIGRLTGEIKNKTFTKDDEIASHLNVIITQMVQNDAMNKTIYQTLNKKANVIATFGVISDGISRAEFYGEWDVFDKNPKINEALDRIMS